MLNKEERDNKLKRLKEENFQKKFGKIICEINDSISDNEIDKWIDDGMVDSQFVLFTKKYVKEVFQIYGVKISIGNMIEGELLSVLAILERVPKILSLIGKLKSHGYKVDFGARITSGSYILGKILSKDNYVITIY